MVSWQPKPCCLGPVLHRAESQAVEPGEKEHRYVTNTNTTNWAKKTFPPSLGTGAVFYFVLWADEHGHEDCFFWRKVDRDQENTSLRTSQTDREDKAWPLHVIWLYCHRTAPLHTARHAQCTSRTGSWLSHGKRLLYIFLHLFYGGVAHDPGKNPDLDKRAGQGLLFHFL